MINRAAELALLGCVPMCFVTSNDSHPRVVGPKVVAILAEGFGGVAWQVCVHARLKADHYELAEWVDMQLETVPAETYDAFLEAIRP